MPSGIFAALLLVSSLSFSVCHVSNSAFNTKYKIRVYFLPYSYCPQCSGTPDRTMLDMDTDDPILETDAVVVAARRSSERSVAAAVPAANGGLHCLDKLTAFSQ